MRKFLFGLLLGLFLATTTFAFADQPIKLIVNGVDITPRCDVPPQIIDGRTLVPARFLAEALGAKVEWDEVNRAVVITKATDQQPQEQASNNSLMSLKDISKLPGVIVGQNGEGNENYISKGNLKILLHYNPESNSDSIINLSVVEGNTILEQSTARVINCRTYLSVELLARYGFVPKN